MELERVISKPETLEKLRRDPLGMHIDGFYAWLLRRGYKQQSIRLHLTNISHFNEHLGRQKTVLGQLLRSTEVDDFFAAYPWGRAPLKNSKLLLQRHSVRCFVEYLGEKGLFIPLIQQEIYQPLLDAYLSWMAHYQNVTAETLRQRAHDLTTFLKWLGTEATPQGLATLTPNGVETFFLAYAQKVGAASRSFMQSALRTFFRFCMYQGYIHVPLDLAVPTLRTYKLAPVPHGLTDAQAQQVLQGVNRKTCVGRRNYAILQLLFTYGVRGCQLRALRLDQIDWNRNQILFEASKNGKASLLPLTLEVGESILDYLQNARPSSPHTQVFLTKRAPCRPLSHTGVLYSIVASSIQAVGIDVPHKGTHTFRHAFATRMLQ
jgi:site-specific recombinase XerD